MTSSSRVFRDGMYVFSRASSGLVSLGPSVKAECIVSIDTNYFFQSSDTSITLLDKQKTFSFTQEELEINSVLVLH